MLQLICHRDVGWEPKIRPASPFRDWMQDSPEQFAYRCLPLNIANSHGWELLNQCNFSVRWRGGKYNSDVDVKIHSSNGHNKPVSLFGMGTITFHVEGIFRTSPGWNLWVGGSPNYFKDGMQPLTGIIETDWLSSSFTMNWKITRENHWIDWVVDEPFCFFFPLPRKAITTVKPRFKPFAEAPKLAEEFATWSRARDEFQEKIRTNPPPNSSEHWEKHYYKGTDMKGNKFAEHVTKLRLPEFKNDET